MQCYLVAKIGTNTRDATWWPKLELMQVKIEKVEDKKLKKVEEKKEEEKMRKS